MEAKQIKTEAELIATVINIQDANPLSPLLGKSPLGGFRECPLLTRSQREMVTTRPRTSCHFYRLTFDSVNQFDHLDLSAS
jgi:hypothetical protein